MVQFSVNGHRFDPYKNFKFRLQWDGVYVAGVSKVSPLKRTTEVVKHRSGGDANAVLAPGRTSYEPVTVERGITHDRAFLDWAEKVWSYGAGLGAESSLKDFRKDIRLELYNEAGQLVIAYDLFQCWVSEIQALPEMDANANAVAIEHLKIEHEGWKRDWSVAEPTEPTLGG